MIGVFKLVLSIRVAVLGLYGHTVGNSKKFWVMASEGHAASDFSGHATRISAKIAHVNI